jgi:anti-sigma factor RsiW
MCSESENLTAYVDDELPAEARAAFEAHLASCPTCPGELALLRRALPPLRALPRLEPTADLRRRVLTRLTPARPSFWERLSLGWAAPLGTLAASVAVFGVVMALSSGHAGTGGGAEDELGLARNLDLVENLTVVASADLSDEDLEVVAQLDQLERGRN